MAHNVDIGRLNDSTDINAKLTEIYYNLALGYIRLGKLEAAGEAVSEALCLDPDYESARKLLNRKTTAYHLISDFRNLCYKPMLYEKFEKRQPDWV